MTYNPETVISRDGTCRLRFPGCTRHATHVLLDVPEYLGGEHTDSNAVAACGYCWGTQSQHRARAAELYAA